MTRHKFNAFTIMELTVAMLISAIVIAISYTAFNMVGKVYKDYQKRQTELAVIMRLDQLLRRDFTRSHHIFYYADSLSFLVDSQKTSYSFSVDKIIRKGGITDTFKVTGAAPVIMFEGSTQAPSNDSLRVDEMFFEIEYQKNRFPYHYKKKYSSEEFFK